MVVTDEVCLTGPLPSAARLFSCCSGTIHLPTPTRAIGVPLEDCDGVLLGYLFGFKPDRNSHEVYDCDGNFLGYTAGNPSDLCLSSCFGDGYGFLSPDETTDRYHVVIPPEVPDGVYTLFLDGDCCHKTKIALRRCVQPAHCSVHTATRSNCGAPPEASPRRPCR